MINVKSILFLLFSGCLLFFSTELLASDPCCNVFDKHDFKVCINDKVVIIASDNGRIKPLVGNLSKIIECPKDPRSHGYKGGVFLVALGESYISDEIKVSGFDILKTQGCRNLPLSNKMEDVCMGDDLSAEVCIPHTNICEYEEGNQVVGLGLSTIAVLDAKGRLSIGSADGFKKM